MKNVFIDSDVILDFFLNREPFSEYAANILSRCENGELIGFTSPLIISNVYYILGKVSSHRIIIENLIKLLKIIKILEVNEDVLLKALNSKFKDFEDAIQNFTAVHSNNVEVILTRNIKDYKKSSLAVFSPESFIKGYDIQAQ